MAIKSWLRYIIFTVLFLPALSLLQAQNSGYSLHTDGAQPRFVQHLAWTADEHAFRYEVVIEREDDGTYRNVLREFVNTSVIDVSLPPGKYRYHVIPHDFLDLPGEASRWVNIEILAALSPEIDSYSHGINELNLSGKHLLQEADVFLINSNGEYIFPHTFISRNGHSMHLSFARGQLIPGDYEIVVRNPGGIQTSKAITFAYSGPESEPSNPANTFLSESWMPWFPVYGEGSFGQNMSLAGAGVRFAKVFFERGFLDFAAEATVSSYLMVGFNLLVQKWFSGKETALNFRLGAGIPLPGSSPVHANMGVSFMWVYSKPVYLETGLDYLHWFTGDFSGCLQPWIGLGLWF